MILVDSSIWIELFEGTEKGLSIKENISKNKCYTSIVSISEVVKWCLQNKFDEEFYIRTIEENSLVLNLKKNIVKLAGKINFEQKKKYKKFGMIDALIYTTGLTYGLKTITKDQDFKGLPNVEIF